MKSVSKLILGMLLLSAPVVAAETAPYTAGLDFEMPYIWKANGATVKTRGNLNMGVDGRWWANETVNAGARLSFDVENKTGLRQIAFAPGAQYHFMAGSAFRPFVRADLPILLRQQRDMAIAGGAGVAWKLGESTGMENLAIRYDFDVVYNFGLGNAVDAVSINFFKIGLDYRF